MNIAHVKVEADLTKLLLSEGELVRQSGEIINVAIDYPWVPPSCTHCRRIGHIIKNCIYPPAKDPADIATGSNAADPNPTVNLQGYSPNVSMETLPVVAVSDDMEVTTVPPVPVVLSPLLESDSQAVVDFITDTLLPLSETVLPITSSLSTPPPPLILTLL